MRSRLKTFPGTVAELLRSGQGTDGGGKAARQAAWALTGTLPDWPIPVLSQHEPTAADQRAAKEIGERYRSVLAAHFGV